MYMHYSKVITMINAQIIASKIHLFHFGL